MSFWKKLFGGARKAESIALIEIGPDSIAAGFAHFKEGEMPRIVYANRLAIQIAKDEAPALAVARTLSTLGEQVLREGAPVLARAVGSARINSVLVSVKAPWQETSIRSEKIERTSSFAFTRSMLSMALTKAAEAPRGRLLADEFIVGTILDGYETTKPVGKRASRISIIVLSSFIDEGLSVAVAQCLRKLFHTSSIRLVAAAAIRYVALRTLFPHEDDYLTLDIAGDSVVTTLLRRGLLSAVEHSVTVGTDTWLEALRKTLEAITKRYPLPRKILLLTSDHERAELKQKIETAPLASLRLSDEPPIVVPVTPSQLTDLVRTGENLEPDLGLGLMATFWQHAEH